MHFSLFPHLFVHVIMKRKIGLSGSIFQLGARKLVIVYKFHWHAKLIVSFLYSLLYSIALPYKVKLF